MRLSGKDIEGKAGDEAEARIADFHAPAVSQVDTQRNERIAIQFLRKRLRIHCFIVSLHGVSGNLIH
jgi:hypothetical protein